MSGWWAVFALALVAGLKAFEPTLRKLWRRVQTKRSLRRLRRAVHEQARWEPREQLDDDTEAHGI